MKLSGFFYQTIEKCNNIPVNLRRRYMCFKCVCAEVWSIGATKKKFFYSCETVIRFIFFNETGNSFSLYYFCLKMVLRHDNFCMHEVFNRFIFIKRKREIAHDTRFIALLYVKNEILKGNRLFFL